MRKRRARGLVEALDLFRDLLPLQHAERFDQLERDTARHAGDVFGCGQREQRRQQLLDMGLEPEIEPRLHQFARRPGQMLVGDDAHARPQRVVAGGELADQIASPAQSAVVGQHDLIVGCLRKFRGARFDLAGQRFLRGRIERLGFRAGGGGIGREHEAVEPADHMAFDRDFAGLSDFGFQHRVLSQPPHQHAGAAVHEAFGQTFVQRIGQLVFDGARDALPMLGVGKPVRSVGNESPGPDMRDPVGESVDVAVGPVGLGNLTGEPIGRDVTLSHQKSIEGDDQFGMGRRRDFAIVGNLAGVP